MQMQKKKNNFTGMVYKLRQVISIDLGKYQITLNAEYLAAGSFFFIIPNSSSTSPCTSLINTCQAFSYFLP